MSFAPLTHTQKDAASSPITTTAIDTTGAKVIAVSAGAAQGSGTLTDSQSNHWYAVHPTTIAGSQAHFLFVCFNPSTSAAHTFTWSAGSFPAMCVGCWSGPPGTMDNPTSATVSPSATLTLPSITPASAGALLITGLCAPNPDTASINSGFTIFDQGGGTNGQKIALAYLIQSVAAAVGPAWTLSSSRTYSASMLGIELSGASVGGGGAVGAAGAVIGQSVRRSSLY